IFNIIFKYSVFPDKWKISSIRPIHKKGNFAEIENYRPITYINNFAKVFEIMLHNLIYPHVSNYIIPQQHGFVKGRSTITNLFVKTQFMSECLDNRSQVDCIYTDFSKAFDRINHNLLLTKLNDFGFSDCLISMFASYLKDRYQYVYCLGY